MFELLRLGQRISTVSLIKKSVQKKKKGILCGDGDITTENGCEIIPSTGKLYFFGHYLSFSALVRSRRFLFRILLKTSMVLSLSGKFGYSDSYGATQIFPVSLFVKAFPCVTGWLGLLTLSVFCNQSERACIERIILLIF
jgi:hypothetical protein